MKINIKRYFLPLAAVLFMVGCHEAVEPEAIDVNYSSFEETNPELYARYMQALREYKAGSHKAVFVTMTVPENGAATTHRTQHYGDTRQRRLHRGEPGSGRALPDACR